MRRHRQRSEKLKRRILGLVGASSDVNEGPVIRSILTFEEGVLLFLAFLVFFIRIRL